MSPLHHSTAPFASPVPPLPPLFKGELCQVYRSSGVVVRHIASSLLPAIGVALPKLNSDGISNKLQKFPTLTKLLLLVALLFFLYFSKILVLLFHLSVYNPTEPPPPPPNHSKDTAKSYLVDQPQATFPVPLWAIFLPPGLGLSASNNKAHRSHHPPPPRPTQDSSIHCPPLLRGLSVSLGSATTISLHQQRQLLSALHTPSTS